MYHVGKVEGANPNEPTTRHTQNRAPFEKAKCGNASQEGDLDEVSFIELAMRVTARETAVSVTENGDCYSIIASLLLLPASGSGPVIYGSAKKYIPYGPLTAPLQMQVTKDICKCGSEIII